MKKVIILLVALVWITGANAQPCLPEGITFTTQEQIDNFQSNYPGCTEIEGDVTIGGYDITNLNGLNVVTTIGGYLWIGQTDALTCLAGLDNLSTIGGELYIEYNNALTSLTGLENLTSIGGSLVIQFEPSLTSLSGLYNLTFIGGDLFLQMDWGLTSLAGLDNLTSIGGGLEFIFNYSLTSLSGLDNLTNIDSYLYLNGNYALSSLSGLDNLISIGDDLSIFNSPALTSITGLYNLTIIGGNLEIANDTVLSSLAGLENLISIGGDLEIFDNNALTSLSPLENTDASSITNLWIHNNLLLSTCDVLSICNYLAAPNGTVEIYDNAPGCNSPEEVEEHCLTTVKELNAEAGITIIPNPSNDKITISSLAISGDNQFSIFNVSGEKVIERQLTVNETQIDISALPWGVYFVKLQNEKMVDVGKMVKE